MAAVEIGLNESNAIAGDAADAEYGIHFIGGGLAAGLASFHWPHERPDFGAVVKAEKVAQFVHDDVGLFGDGGWAAGGICGDPDGAADGVFVAE